MSACAPLVSVLIASRNGARYLDEALASLAAQTFPALEIVAVDDGSTDDTPKILAAFAERHGRTRVHRTAGLGLAGALALAARDAHGDLLARQDDDDRSAPERMARQVAAFESRPELSVLGTGARVIDAGGRTAGTETVPLGSAAIIRALRRGPPFVHGSVMMRRAAYEQTGGYREAFGASQDYDLWLRMAPAAIMANLPEPLYEWRRHKGGVFARAREEQLFFAALARAFADERTETGADAIAAFAAATDRDAFIAGYPHARRLLREWGERLARDGRTGAARAKLLKSFRRGGGARALLWWLATGGIALTPRARRAAARPEAE
jgi:glycosyltransferase involved in cell wall biosynthesis